MTLVSFLAEKRAVLIKRWREEIVCSYPEETQRFLKKDKNSFTNPVGHIMGKEIETLYDEVVGAKDTSTIETALENIIRIRAVQDFKPSHAISFVYALKDLVREELGPEGLSKELLGEIQAFDKGIDQLALLAFDIYSRCRQKIYEIRVNEVKVQVEKLLKRANLMYEFPQA